MDPRYQDFGTENELAEILSHYNSNFVYDIVNDQINRIKSGTFTMISTPPNVVAAWEQNFKAIMDQYGADGAIKIQEVRHETYREIIDIICKAYNINFTIAEVDIYSAAYTLYDFFVCKLNNFITKFYANYIYKERTAIYESMGLSEMKKNKDSSTIYGKRMYKDIKIAVITANITRIIDNINNSIEISFDTFLSVVLNDNRTLYKYIISLISDKGNFFYDVVIPTLNNNLAEYITGVRFAIQEYATAHDMIQYSKDNETVTQEE